MFVCVVESLSMIRRARLVVERLSHNLYCFAGSSGCRWMRLPGITPRSPRTASSLIEHDAAGSLFDGVVAQERAQGLLCLEHFSVDGSPVQAWASLKSFVPKDGTPPASGSKRNPRGQLQGREAHQ